MSRKNKFKTHLNEQEELLITLKKELVILKIKQTTKQNFKPHLTKEIKNKISRIKTLGKIIK
uniref:Ribosomal protein L29 n=1 Tax=Osmundea sinicola TaxID=290685 RepID=A0A7L4WPE4_9FLOR|nr:ribosomal protein L29 [Osmundea sinicola]QFR99931.1 ribosomal protein L29 [Osmundea sinicola]